MKLLAFATLALLVLAGRPLPADSLPERIHEATRILEKKQGSATSIPQAVIAHCKGIAFATVTKGGLGIGGLGGEGVILLHNGNWSAPFAYDLAGGSIGAQIGFSTTRYILVLNSNYAVSQFTHPGKLKWDATAMGTAGEDNGIESQTTAELEAREILVYRDSGGLFGGATVGGSNLTIRDDINQAAYGPHTYIRDILESRVTLPPSANRLYQILNGQR